jgi:uncharacterized protein (TIGR03000 family)
MEALARWRPVTLLLALALFLTPAYAQEKADPKKPDEKKAPEKKAEEKEQPATVVFRLYPDAVLTIDGERTRQTGAERKFKTPPLEPGKRYFYIAVAVWEPNNYTKITRTRKIYVEAGKQVEVDFRKEDPKQPDKIFVRYVPTPPAVVEAMLKLGKVGKDDVVYDLGCGDGRIPVTAVAKYGAKRGVGIDLDPQRIKESKENARRAGVEGKVEFRQADVLKLADLGDASVVTLYLGEDINRQLEPILRKSLKPGSRVVSHRFLIGDWKPDRTEELTAEGMKIRVHLWTVKGEEKKDDKKDDKKEEEKKDG